MKKQTTETNKVFEIINIALKVIALPLHSFQKRTKGAFKFRFVKQNSYLMETNYGTFRSI